MKLWDYSHLWGNVQGRIAPIISLFLGIRVGFLVKVIQPFVQKLIIWEEIKTHGYLALIIVIVMGTDSILTIFSVGKLQMSTKSWNERLNTRMKLDEGKLNQAFDKLMETLSWNQKRFLTSFPQLKFTDTKKFNKFKNRWIKKRRES